MGAIPPIETQAFLVGVVVGVELEVELVVLLFDWEAAGLAPPPPPPPAGALDAMAMPKY
jgi:hypothetical protein